MAIMIDRFIANGLLVAEYFSNWRGRPGRLYAVRERHRQRLEEGLAASPPCPSRSLTEIDAREANPRTFRRASANFTRPVVIRGLMAGSSSVRNWGPDYLAERCGDTPYRVIIDARTDSRSEGVLKDAARFEMISVRVLVASIAAGGRFKYLSGATQLLLDHPELVADLELERLARLFRSGTADRFDVLNLLVGGKGTGSLLHCAFAGNLFINILGRKRWRLIDPSHTPYVMAVPVRPFFYAAARIDPWEQDGSVLVEKLPTFEVTLTPGDVLYNAPWWWHRVENLEPFNVGSAVRFGRLFADLHNNPVLTLLCKERELYLSKAAHRLQNLFRGNKSSFREKIMIHQSRQELARSRMDGRAAPQ